MSINVAQWTFFLSVFVLPVCSSPCSIATPGNIPSFFHFFHCCFRIRNFHCLRHKNKLGHQIVVTHRIEPQLCGVICMIFLVEQNPNAFSWIHASTMHACFCLLDFGGTLGFVVGHPRLVRTLLRSLFPRHIQGISASPTLSLLF